MKLRIAIDGPASAGKGTVARMVARALDYQYVDTGAMYRTVALVARERGVPWSDAEGVARVARSLGFRFAWDQSELRVQVDGRDVTSTIRTEDLGRGASDVGAHGSVRAALLELQRSLAAEGGVVMDGRDIGTVVLPDAEVKIFLDASIDERARRRHAELLARGLTPEPDALRREIAARDDQDRHRAVAPLRQADDAIYLDTTGLTPEQAANAIVEHALGRAARV